MYDLDIINRALEGAGVAARDRIFQFDSIDSTNKWLMKQADCHAMVCLSEHQYSGKGRLGRRWRDTPGGSILMSFGWCLQRDMHPAMSLMAGVVVAQALEHNGLEGVQLKWPNDVLYDNKKLAGILIEIKQGDCIAGIGINQHLHESDGCLIDQGWTDLERSGAIIERERLVADIISGLCEAYNLFESNGIESFIDSWQTYHAWQDREVIVSNAGYSYRATALGVSKEGALIVLRDNRMEHLNHGDVSLALSSFDLAEYG